MRTQPLWPVLAGLVGLWQAERLSAGVIYASSLRTGADAAWRASRGDWDWTPGGLSNAKHGENRIFLDLENPSASYAIHFSAELNRGLGWSLFFGAALDSRNRVDGFSFEYDPGRPYGEYLLHDWNGDHEHTLRSVSGNLDFGAFHDFTLEITPTLFRAWRDGQAVLAYDGPLTPAGTLAGFQTRGNSEALFKDFSIVTDGAAAMPEPLPLLLAVGPAFFFLRRKAK